MNHFNNLSASVPMQVKIFVMIIAVIILISGFSMIEIRQSLNETLSKQLDERIKSIGSDVAARSRDLLLTHNVYLLYELAQETVKNNPDVEYVVILDENDKVIVHTFQEQSPSTELIKINNVTQEKRYNLIKFMTSKGIIRDVAVPVFEGIGGTVRVGLTEQSLYEALSKITINLFITMFLLILISGLVTFSLTKILTAPIKHLLNVTKEVSKGNLAIRARAFANDEVGKLADAFNAMLTSLQKVEQEKEGYYQKVSLRNRELSLLNDLRGNITSSKEMEKLLNDFFIRLIKELDFNAGILKIKLLNEWKTFIYSNSTCPNNNGIPYSNCEHCYEYLRKRYKFSINVKDDLIGYMEICSNQELDERSIDILKSLSYQISVSVENMQLWDELKQKEEVRIKLLEKVINAQEEERKRIARELHDETSQSLTSLLLGLSVLSENRDEQERLDSIQELKILVKQTLQEVHEMAWQLRPSILDKFGLTVAIERYIEEYRQTNHLDVDLYISGMEKYRLQSEIEITIYRIIQEALTNVARYAKAQNVSVIIELIGSILSVIIEDDGIGFNVEEILKRDPTKYNLGIMGMQERVLLIGGKFIIESEIGKGTTLFVKIPLVQGGGKNNGEDKSTVSR